MWAESTQKVGVKERRISSIYTLNFETKNLLSDRAWVDLESSSIFFCVFLCFGYRITENREFLPIILCTPVHLVGDKKFIIDYESRQQMCWVLWLESTGLDYKSERFSWFFDDKMENMQPIFIKIDT